MNHVYESCVFYKFKCPGNLNNQYFVQTEQQLIVRINEQRTPPNVAVFKHIENFAYCKSCKNIYNCLVVIEICISYFTYRALKRLQLNSNNRIGPDKRSRLFI